MELELHSHLCERYRIGTASWSDASSGTRSLQLQIVGPDADAPFRPWNS
jgi:hypothetical protein